MRVPARRIGALLLAAALVTTGCSGDGSDDGKDAAPTIPGFQPPRKANEGIVVEATDHKFKAPSAIDGGVVTMTLRNKGDKTHNLSFIDIGDTPISRWAPEFKALITATGPAPPVPGYIKTTTGVAGRATPGSQVTQTFTMPPGRYVMYCDLSDDDTIPLGPGPGQGAGRGGGVTATPVNAVLASAGQETQTTTPITFPGRPPQHFELGMTKTITVRAPSKPAELPSDVPTIVATDWAFTVPTIDPGHVTLQVRNDGPNELHHAVLLAYSGDVTPEDAKKALVEAIGAQFGGPPPTLELGFPDSVGGSTVFTPGQGGTFDVTLRAGLTFALACFLPDRDGGLPHLLSHGMVTTFRLEE